MREQIKKKVERENISLYSISKNTQLAWITVKNYIQTDLPFNPTTESLIKNYLKL